MNIEYFLMGFYTALYGLMESSDDNSFGKPFYNSSTGAIIFGFIIWVIIWPVVLLSKIWFWIEGKLNND